VLEPVEDGIGDHGVGDDLGPVLERSCEVKTTDSGPIVLEDFAEVLRLRRCQLATAHFIEDDQVELGELIAIRR